MRASRTLDGRTRSALTQARHAALAELEDGKHSGAWQIWGPLSGVAAAAFVLVVMFAPIVDDNAELPRTAVRCRSKIWTSLPMPKTSSCMENLDFYAWLDSAEALPNDG